MAIKVINKIISWGLVLLVGLIPLFFLPFTSDFYEFNKNMLLFVIVGILLILWLLKMVLSGQISFKKNVFDLPVLLIAAAFILSTIFNAPNKWEVFWLPGGTGTILGLTILYFVMTNVIRDTQYVRRVIQALIISGVILSLVAIYQFIGLKTALIGVNLLFPAFLQGFSPTGGLIPLATFLAVSLSLAITRIYTNWKANQHQFSTVLLIYCFTALLILAGLGITIWQLFTTAKPLLLPYSTSWAIAVESFKNWRLFLLGIGPNSFLDAFTQFRPVSYNLGNLWAIRFGASGNWYFHLLTTVGILGLGAFLWLVWKSIKTQPKFSISNFQFSMNFQFSIFLILVILLFLPANFLLLFSLYLLLALFALSLPPKGEYIESSKIAAWSIFIPATLIILACFYFVGRTYAAEVYFRNSLQSFANNAGNDAYNNQIKAITLNPYNDVYRIAYSQTNLALANSLAAKSDLTDQDRQNITVLVQQAIREAKVAVNLNQNKVTNWENLAGIYRQLINFAQGADQWAITALSQAIKLDPNNPNLKLNLGGIYYALNNYDEAIRFFQQAIDVKPNFANGYYNLAAAYREKSDWQKAHDAMQITLNLVPSNSEDYNKARTELDDLAKKIPVKEATQAATVKPQPEEIPEAPLIEPQPYPSPVIKPPLELPEGAAPPAPEISPAPEATP